MTSLIVTHTATIMDGPVVRWFASESDANDVHPIVSASRNGVIAHRPAAIDNDLAVLAADIHESIRDWSRRGGHDFRTWMRHVTHERPTLLGDVQPVRFNEFGERVTA